MSNLILELFSEEIPAKIQFRAIKTAEELIAKIFAKLSTKDLEIKGYITPRRIAIAIENLPKEILAPKISVKGPKTSANPKAISGFMEKYNLKDSNDLTIKNIKKDAYYFYEVPESLIDITAKLPELLAEFIKEFAKTWPKTMRWGSYKMEWIRPLRNILCLLDDKIIKFSYEHLTANNLTYGHRFLSKNQPLKVTDYDAYYQILAENFVILDHLKRQTEIASQLKNKAAETQLKLIENQALLEEVTGLVEYPVILQGQISKEFMFLPKEVLIATIKNHQKYFCVTNQNNELQPYFIFVSNNKIKDEQQIILGNQKVLNARLNDAKYFYETDIKTSLEERYDLLEKIIFHKNIGNMAKKSANNAILAKFLAVWVPDSHLADIEVAAQLAKTDLTTEMVNELPELQGIMGYYYALQNGLNNSIALAIKEHYLPQGNSDLCPQHPVAIAVSLADKLDSLVSLILVNELPTGSKDPYGVRRLAIGIIKILLQHKLNIPLGVLINKALNNHPKLLKNYQEFYPDYEGKDFKQFIQGQILEFIIDRFKTILKNNEISHDIINAVFDAGNEDDLLRIYKKSQYLSTVIDTQQGQNIIAAYRRAYKIYYKAEQDDGVSYEKRPYYLIFKQEEEKELFKIYKTLKNSLPNLLKCEKYDEAFDKVQEFIDPLENFFDKIIVNDAEQHLRQNRLKLLASLCKTVNNVANFNKILQKR